MPRTTRRPRYTAADALAVFRELATTELVDAADEKLRTHQASWHADPSVADVFGLIEHATGQALVVVYLRARDFEANESVLLGY